MACENAIVAHCKANYREDSSACADFNDVIIRGGCDYDKLPKSAIDALQEGITKGRDGKGIVFVFASGNAYFEGDDVNMSRWSNSRYTITVGAVGKDGIHTDYSTPGAALHVTGPAGDYDDVSQIMTAGLNGKCTNSGPGTSFSCPVVSGVIALILEARPELTWRDVQGILASTSNSKNDARDKSAMTNKAGFWHSDWYGFGIIDAKKAVDAALKWELWTPEQQAIGESKEENEMISNDGTAFTSELTIGPEYKGFKAESAVVLLNLQHYNRGDLQLTLVSPSGTESVLHAGKRPEDNQLTGDERWKLMTVRNWGEDPTGKWKLKVQDLVTDNTDTEGENEFRQWKLTVYGQMEDMPELSTPTTSPTKAALITSSPTKATTTDAPTKSPTKVPTASPVFGSTSSPVVDPINAPVVDPTNAPVVDLTNAPVLAPTNPPTSPPTLPPTNAPVVPTLPPFTLVRPTTMTRRSPPSPTSVAPLVPAPYLQYNIGAVRRPTSLTPPRPSSAGGVPLVIGRTTTSTTQTRRGGIPLIGRTVPSTTQTTTATTADNKATSNVPIRSSRISRFSTTGAAETRTVSIEQLSLVLEGVSEIPESSIKSIEVALEEHTNSVVATILPALHFHSTIWVVSMTANDKASRNLRPEQGPSVHSVTIVYNELVEFELLNGTEDLKASTLASLGFQTPHDRVQFVNKIHNEFSNGDPILQSLVGVSMVALPPSPSPTASPTESPVPIIAPSSISNDKKESGNDILTIFGEVNEEDPNITPAYGSVSYVSIILIICWVAIGIGLLGGAAVLVLFALRRRQ